MSRTPDPRLRRPLLCPAELRARMEIIFLMRLPFKAQARIPVQFSVKGLRGFPGQDLGKLIDAGGQKGVDARVMGLQDFLPFVPDSGDRVQKRGGHGLAALLMVEGDGKAMDLVLHPHEQEEQRLFRVQGIGFPF